MNRPMWIVTVLTAIVGAALLPGSAVASPAAGGAGSSYCAPAWPGTDFYAAGRVGSERVTVPTSGCSTISVSQIRDVRDPNDRCQTFLVAMLPRDGGDPTYTDPVRACSSPPQKRTVLATNVPDGTVFFVLYEVDYIVPEPQQVRFTVWR
ncbi:hypothetical protein SAMN05421812_11184 [Asanoa hainanensis]|uniref:Subtilisin inhibitor-like n=1 Tax=Asanoa hainanensis TaxID=560556 RepID=A0A239NXP5_9ACTN|nr:hypothetical protein [Asanoa hainanensis]SNT58889.1 hypothetical protein SAMN05421812_11184 [Asanoa hainanensis]